MIVSLRMLTGRANAVGGFASDSGAQAPAPRTASTRRLAAVAAAATLCAAVVLIAPAPVVGDVFAVPLCLILPGYALTAAVFAKRQLEFEQRLMLVLALSFVTLVLGSLVLNLTPGGLRKLPWTILLLIVTLGGCASAHLRQPATRRRERSRPRARATRLDVAFLVAAAILAAGAVALSRVPLSAPNAVGYADLWMLPAGTALAPSVQIGVVSDQLRTTHFSLLLRVGPARRRARVVDSSLVLEPGQQRKFTVSLPRSTLHSTGLVTAMLYKAGSAGVDRQVSADLPPVPAPQ